VIVNTLASKLASEDNLLALTGISPMGEAEPFGESMLHVRRQ